jgi:hypothetical protein
MQKLMRHSDPKLTAGVYTHLRLVDEAAEIAKLPAMLPSFGPESEAARATGTDDLTAADRGENMVTQMVTFAQNFGDKIKTYTDFL